MINKQGLLFLTLTSLILVLSVYYITMPNELLLTTNSSYNNSDTDIVNSDVNNNEEVNVNITETSTIEAMRNILEDERLKSREELNNKLVEGSLTVEEINNVYEELKYMTKIEGLEETIEQKIKSEFDLSSFVKISDDIVEVTVSSNKHDAALVVKIIGAVQEELESKMYVSVSFKE